MKIRCFKWTAGVMYCAWTSVQAFPPGVEIPPAANLAASASAAVVSCRPLLLEFASDSCPFCERLEDEHLLPMRRNAGYDSRVVMRRVELYAQGSLGGFDGKPITPGGLARSYGISVVPTVLFLDADGKEIAERLIGYNTPELYGAYLENALEAATSLLKEHSACEAQNFPDFR